MLKRQTRAIGDLIRRRRGDMATPGRRVIGWIESLFIDHTVFRLLVANRHRVTYDLWRSAQPLPMQLAAARRRGIVSVVNLTGSRDTATHRLERDACRRLGLRLVEYPLDSRDPPSRERIAGLERVFEGLDYPALIHCKSGADRAGIASALYLLLREGRSVEEAKAQLSPRFGHIRQGPTGVLDHMLDRYAADAAESPMTFREWLDARYDPAAIKREFRSRRWGRFLVDRLLRRE